MTAPAQKLKISDLPKIGSYVTVHPKEDWGPGLVTHSRLKFIEIVWACEGGETSMSWSGKNVKTGLSFIKPSAQPHVAAGSGFKERMRSFFSRLWCQEFGLHEAEEKFDAMLAEVVELPSVDLKTIQETADQYVVDFGQEISLQLAAALIRAATSSDPSA